MSATASPIALFGYHSSAFTQKVKLALRLRQIPYTFVKVPSMLPRPTLVDYFNLTYRKIPVLAIGRELYVDTSLIVEALNSLPGFQNLQKHPTLHPDPTTRAFGRILSSHYTDRPLFRLICGVMPAVIWRSQFGIDRADLIGHKLDPDKLERKIPRNTAGLDTYLSILEPLFNGQKWLLDTEKPSAADVSLYYQLDWGEKVSRGEYISDLTAAEAADGSDGEGIGEIFNEQRYPGLMEWFKRFRAYVDRLPETEVQVIEKNDTNGIAKFMDELNAAEQAQKPPLLPTPHSNPPPLDDRIGLKIGAKISIAPDDTGRAGPTIGTLVAASSEEVVIIPEPVNGAKAKVDGIRLHFPRVGFVIAPTRKEDAKL